MTPFEEELQRRALVNQYRNRPFFCQSEPEHFHKMTECEPDVPKQTLTGTVLKTAGEIVGAGLIATMFI